MGHDLKTCSSGSAHDGGSTNCEAHPGLLGEELWIIERNTDHTPIEFDIGTENAVFLAKEDHCLQVEPHLLLEPVLEALNNYMVDSLHNLPYGLKSYEPKGVLNSMLPSTSSAKRKGGFMAIQLYVDSDSGLEVSLKSVPQQNLGRQPPNASEFCIQGVRLRSEFRPSALLGLAEVQNRTILSLVTPSLRTLTQLINGKLKSDDSAQYVLKNFYRLKEDSENTALDQLPFTVDEHLIQIQAEASRLAMAVWFLKAFLKYANDLNVSADINLAFAEAFLAEEISSPSPASGVEQIGPVTALWSLPTFKVDPGPRWIQDEMILFDPMTHAREGTTGVGDFGIEGIQSFLRDHICCYISHRLGLDCTAALVLEDNDQGDDQDGDNDGHDLESLLAADPTEAETDQHAPGGNVDEKI
ncbi:hypothetical protein B0H14DRAFT_2612015 [Mycena olivaceomarginata]|nr:hypothetical protein B0H14DRAFT_2612015 [Mycena olivaceomarginata]